MSAVANCVASSAHVTTRPTARMVLHIVGFFAFLAIGELLRSDGDCVDIFDRLYFESYATFCILQILR